MTAAAGLVKIDGTQGAALPPAPGHAHVAQGIEHSPPKFTESQSPFFRKADGRQFDLIQKNIRPCSSAGQSNRLLSGRSDVRIVSWVPFCALIFKSYEKSRHFFAAKSGGTFCSFTNGAKLGPSTCQGNTAGRKPGRGTLQLGLFGNLLTLLAGI